LEDVVDPERKVTSARTRPIPDGAKVISDRVVGIHHSRQVKQLRPASLNHVSGVIDAVRPTGKPAIKMWQTVRSRIDGTVGGRAERVPERRGVGDGRDIVSAGADHLSCAIDGV